MLSQLTYNKKPKICNYEFRIYFYNDNKGRINYILKEAVLILAQPLCLINQVHSFF